MGKICIIYILYYIPGINNRVQKLETINKEKFINMNVYLQSIQENHCAEYPFQSI